MTEQETFHRYPGAQPFRDDDASRKVFFGRDRDSIALADQILANRLVIVYARSGSGKTSLLNAGVAPRLRKAGCVPLFVRVNDLQRGVRAGVIEGISVEAERQKLEYEPGDITSLWSFFKTAEFWRDDDLLTPVLILDQFEELFTLQQYESRDVFLSELGSLLRGVAPSGKDGGARGVSPESPRIHVVLSLREDFLGLLEEASDQIPEIMDHRFRLAPFTAEMARVAITGPAAIRDHSLATRAFRLTPLCVDAILDYLGRCASRRESARLRQIEPFHLQLICQYIENVAALRQKTSAEEVELDLVDIGGEQALADTLKTFYTNAIGSLPKRDRGAAGRMCEQFLISAEGRRLSVDERELWRRAGISSDTLRSLVDQRLLRTDRRSDRTYYELGHDALVQPVLATRRRQAFALFRIAIFAGSAITLPAVGLLVAAIALLFDSEIVYGLLFALPGIGVGFIGILCLRSGSRRRARFSVQVMPGDGEALSTGLPRDKLVFGWVILVLGPAITLISALSFFTFFGDAILKIATSRGLAGSYSWWLLSLGGFAAFGWFLFQRGDQLLWPDEFSVRPASWQGHVLQRGRLLLWGTASLILGGLALTLACLGTAALVSCDSLALRGVVGYLHFAGNFAGTVAGCYVQNSSRPNFIYFGSVTIVLFIVSTLLIFDGAAKIRRDFLLRKNTLKTGPFLQAWAIGAVIAILAPLNLFLWSRVVVARVNTEGWVSGQGYILHTADGGRTWARLGTTAEPLQSLTFTSRLSGWATGNQGLWHTEDGGIHWNLKLASDDQRGHPIRVAFGSPQSGLILWSYHYDLSKTIDGGNTWSPSKPLSSLVPSPDSSPGGMAFIGPQAAWLVTHGGRGLNPILHSADGGSTWSLQDEPNFDLYAVSFSNAQSGWAVGDSGSIVHTANAGSTWERQNTNDNQSGLKDVASLSPSSAIAVGPGVVLLTRDGGQDWINVPDLFSEGLSQVVFASPTTGWILAREGIILHSEDAGNTWTVQHPVKGETLYSMAFLRQ